MSSKDRILNRMYRHFINDKERLEQWLDTKNNQLNNKTPRELIDNGKAEVVLELINKTIDA